MAAAQAWTHLVKGMALYVLGDYAAAPPEAQAGRICCAGFGPARWRPSKVSAARPRRPARRFRRRSRARLCWRATRACYGLFQVDNKAVDLFVAGLEKAGLNTAEARAAAGSAEKL
jgi:hypothetical protein